MASLRALQERFLAAQLAGDRRDALEVIADALAEGVAVPQIQIEIIQNAQYEIGRLWETNEINIATEHQATAISQLALAMLYGQLPRAPKNHKRVLLSCVEGELHDMGARICADFLEMEGFDVRLLGASVPPRHLVERAEAYKPDLIALSATMSFHVPAIESAIGAIRSAGTESVRGTPILLGGYALRWSPGVAESLDVQGGAGDAFGVVAEAKRLLLAP